MKEKRESKNMVMGGVLCAVAIAGCSFLFNGATNIVKASELNKDIIVSNDSSNTSNGAGTSTSKASQVPKGYVKANYTVKDFVFPTIPEMPANVNDDSNFGATDASSMELVEKNPVKHSPSEYDLTRDEAAELGVQMIWELFGVDATDKVVTMTYHGKDEISPSNWGGFIEDEDQSGKAYSFSLYSITGERLRASEYESNPYGENTMKPKTVPVNMVESEYFEIAEDYVKKHNLMAGKIVKCENTTPNDDDIPIEDLEAVGSNAEMFSDVVMVRVTDEDGAETDVHIRRPEKEVYHVTYDRAIKLSEIPMNIGNEMRQDYPLYNYQLTDSEEALIDEAIQEAIDEYFS